MYTFHVNVDMSGLEKKMEEMYGLGSKAQETWSWIVFFGSREYMPFVTGQFANISQATTTQTAKYGEIVYGPTPYARYLWNGIVYAGAFYIEDVGFRSRRGVPKVATDRPLQFDTGANSLAGPRWVERAYADLYPKWVAEFQQGINNGFTKATIM